MTAQPQQPAEPVLIRPVRLTRICRVAAVLLVITFCGVGASLRLTGEGAATFALADQIAFGLLGVLLAGLVLTFTRARVIADTSGVRVRGAWGERFVCWQVVARVNLADGEPWANLDLQDDDRIALFAVQANDGERATAGVLALRRLLANSRTQS